MHHHEAESLPPSAFSLSLGRATVGNVYTHTPAAYSKVRLPTQLLSLVE